MSSNGCRLSDEQRQQVRARLQEAPGAMTLQLAAEFGVPELEIIREMPAERVVELDIGRWHSIFEDLPAFGTVHVIVSNGAATLETQGEFGGFSTWGEFFNVQTKTLDMHIRYQNLAAAFAVEKPSHMTGVNTLSVHFYDRAGQCALKIFPAFGDRKTTPELRQRFDELRAKYRL
jgi:putative heme utilization carrier protein HutX